MRRAHLKTGSPPQEGSVHLALDRVQGKHIDADTLQAFFNKTLISPVLTAHPTEVQRKNILDCQPIISSLLPGRDGSVKQREVPLWLRVVVFEP